MKDMMCETAWNAWRNMRSFLSEHTWLKRVPGHAACAPQLTINDPKGIRRVSMIVAQWRNRGDATKILLSFLLAFCWILQSLERSLDGGFFAFARDPHGKAAFAASWCRRTVCRLSRWASESKLLIASDHKFQMPLGRGSIRSYLLAICFCTRRNRMVHDFLLLFLVKRHKFKYK